MSNPSNDRSHPDQSKDDPELKAIYERLRREFSAADLQKYTEIEEVIPAKQVLHEMEKIHEEVLREMKS